MTTSTSVDISSIPELLSELEKTQFILKQLVQKQALIIEELQQKLKQQHQQKEEKEEIPLSVVQAVARQEIKIIAKRINEFNIWEYKIAWEAKTWETKASLRKKGFILCYLP